MGGPRGGQGVTSAKVAALPLSLPLANAERAVRKDELNNLLVELATISEPSFIMEDWVEKVFVAAGSKNKISWSLRGYQE